MYTYSYIYMFLEIYIGPIRLGLKSDFRCEVFKYANICSEKYSHKPPPSPPYPLLKVVSLKRKLSSWGVGASQTHSYIFMFLDIYDGLVRLGIKSDFRCEVFKYAKPCA